MAKYTCIINGFVEADSVTLGDDNIDDSITLFVEAEGLEEVDVTKGDGFISIVHDDGSIVLVVQK